MATKQVVGFSGGIDSQACALYVRQRLKPRRKPVRVRPNMAYVVESFLDSQKQIS